MEREEYQRRLSYLGVTVLMALRAFTIWGILCRDNNDKEPEYENLGLTMDEYTGFFIPVWDICLDFALLSIAKCFDEGGDVVSFNNIIGAAQDSRNDFGTTLSQEQFIDIKNRMKAHKSTYEKIIKPLRDHQIAHSIFLTEPVVIPYSGWHDVAYSKFIALLEDMKQSYNMLAGCFTDAQQITDDLIMCVEHDTEGVLKLVLSEWQQKYVDKESGEYFFNRP